ncbi:arylsulfatase [Polaribacter reichenbachii]|uniref:Arylsulfatase n=1 Tax=Polaribacter reichenbachii TaxID=996801 RepID=A0A1B8U6V2_9FLAO|nr:arylsulfatase [Polaribacter reichenbachii]AUC20562.1 arylsulfatase [Polaribacter reichenbachii]OBY67548.1 arylsulfatase [Polaribacter reichenbachii]
MKSNFKRNGIIFKFLIIFLFFSSCKKEGLKNSNPNILIIIADDAGWNDVGYNGSEINTPNIDFLAKNGVQLNRFYVNPTCSPSRVSLLTGMPASRIGIVAPISGKSKKTLPDSIATLTQVLHKKNYQNALFGKWHLGLDISNGPNAFGFDYSYGFLHGQIDQYTHKYKNGDESWYRNDLMLKEEGHTTDLVTEEAIDWISNKRESSKNFYMQLAYSAPHFPLQEEDKWKTPYLNNIKNDSRRDFAAAMTHMDNSIGKVLKILKEQNLEKNTIIIFMSDNGAMKDWFPKNQYNGDHGPNDVLGSNYPLKEWKASNYEGAIRVPAIVYWKNHLNPEINNNYISISDIMPTILNLINAKIPKDVEGVDVWKTIKNANFKTTHDIYVRGHKQESLIHNSYKIIRKRQKDGSKANYELYNLDKDPEEKNNIINKDSIKTKEMMLLLENQFSKDDKTVNKELG